MKIYVESEQLYQISLETTAFKIHYLSIQLPIKVFEISDVVFKDDIMERRSRNQRNIAAVYCGKSSGFEYIHGLLDRIMLMLNIPILYKNMKIYVELEA